MHQRSPLSWFRKRRAAQLTAVVLAAALLGVSGVRSRQTASAATSGNSDRLETSRATTRAPMKEPLSDLGPMPALDGGLGWINSGPISRESLRGKVAMIEIWTFACINCLHALPHVKETAARYRDKGLVTIGVHTPELPRERPRANVEEAIKKLGVVFPVVLDNNYTIWNAWKNEYWPSVYLVDRKGRIRFHHDGEGQYEELDAAVALLLAEKP